MTVLLLDQLLLFVNRAILRIV